MCRCEGEDVDTIRVILGGEALGGEARRVFEFGEKVEFNEVGNGVFGVTPVRVMQKLGVECASGEVRGVDGEECGEWMVLSEDSDGQGLQDMTVGFVDLVCEGDAVSREKGFSGAAHETG